MLTSTMVHPRLPYVICMHIACMETRSRYQLIVADCSKNSGSVADCYEDNGSAADCCDSVKYNRMMQHGRD